MRKKGFLIVVMVGVVCFASHPRGEENELYKQQISTLIEKLGRRHKDVNLTKIQQITDSKIKMLSENE